MYTFGYAGADGEDRGTAFIYNSDLSGDVRIRRNNAENTELITIDVPGEAILAFVANYVREQKIAQLEASTTAEILGL